MSFDRVLPRPLALSDRELTRRWAAQPKADSLKSAKIMTNETSNSAFQENHQIPPLPSKALRTASSTAVDDQHSTPLAVEEDQSPDLPPEAILSRVRKPAPSNLDTWQEDSPSQICLCQPDPKVPRPRNAFILYRQHHQASVVAQHPGLANPEISKVIGDHWRASPPEVKEHWKLLAEEEKIRHQKQYPDYRYQPRRSGRTHSLSNSIPSAPGSIAEGARRCLKCGGKSISSSNMMSVSTSLSSQESPNTSYQRGREGREGNYGPLPLSNTTPKLSNGRFVRGLGSPPMRDALPHGMHRFSRAQTAQSLPLTSPHYNKRPQDASETSPNSPDPKRRRVTNVTFAPAGRGPQGPQTPFAFPASQQRRLSLPRPDFMGPPVPSPMGPPSSRPAISSQRSDSLKLPPLHTGDNTGGGHKRSLSAETQTKSLEAMIHSIPLLNKIRVLSRISAPLPLTLAPTSPISFKTRRRRGVVMAVESGDATALEQLTQTLERTLTGEYDLKVFPPPQPPENEPPNFQSYLRLVDRYHTLSQQVVIHVSSPATSSSSSLSAAAAAEEEEGEEEEPPESPSPVSPKSFPKEKLRRRTTSPKSTRAQGGPDDGGLPVAVLPSWQLTHTDAFAISVPISDSYSPTDHWQWGATVWRGIVGADVTIAVRPELAPEEHASPPGTAGSGETKMSSNETGKSRFGTSAGLKEKGAAGVEIRLEAERAVVVKGEVGGGVSEGGLRRVGFEIGEWIRGRGIDGGE
ncbi:MAG: hypothetical protein Q9217_001828 [Psora testacea]